MMKSLVFAVARQQQRYAVVSASRGFMSVAAKKSFQSWWVPESREFDIAHDCVRPDCLQAQAAADAEPVVETDVAEQPAMEEEPHVVVETQNWWPHETRCFDIDHDLASTENVRKVA